MEVQFMENKAVILNKFETIEKCINRINEEYEGNSNNLKDYRKMDKLDRIELGVIYINNDERYGDFEKIIHDIPPSCICVHIVLLHGCVHYSN